MQKDTIVATPQSNIDELDAKQFIIIKNAKTHNLKSLSVAIPRNQLIVITGVSGSGKSSLAFDTLFAEGQRMYVESLSSYARQFLGRMPKPEVDYIKGISPAIAIEQKVSTRNPRSTVGTSTEIYDYMKLLFARIGTTYSPISGNVVRRDTVDSVTDYILSLPQNTRLMILAKLEIHAERTLIEELQLLLQKGFTRIIADSQPFFIEEFIQQENPKAESVFILIDRIVIDNQDENARFRIADSVQTAFFEGHDECIVEIVGENATRKVFSDKFELDGITFEEPSVNLFSFNNPYGCCKTCNGFGTTLGIDEKLVIPNPDLSVFQGAIAPWSTENNRIEWLNPFLNAALRLGFPIHKPYRELTQEQKDLIWKGDKNILGLNTFFAELERQQAYKIQARVMLSRYKAKVTCHDCNGTRVRKDAQYVKINGKSIADLVLMPIQELAQFINNITLNEQEAKIAERILAEIRNRVGYLQQVGLGYLTLNRLTSTLSGGEFQRIKLATSLGSALVGSMYILDEPSIGLHPRDTQQLIAVLQYLRNLGNSVIVIEHEEEIMKAADQIIEIGPAAGMQGGQLMWQANINELAQKEFPNSPTLRFLTRTETIAVPTFRRKALQFIHVKGAAENNLKNIDVTFPLGIFTAVTGVSGSGKSTLVRKILYPSLLRSTGQQMYEQVGKVAGISGDINYVKGVEMIDQNPIGRSSRSNPVTYLKAFDAIRELFAMQPTAKQRGYKAGFFSFNVQGGRCESCEGEGTNTIEMQFMADIVLPCEACKGTRYKQETLDVKYQGKSIADVLNMTVDEAIDFFENEKKIKDSLMPLQQVGLGYVSLGQSGNTLSGGEAQRVKLASFLGKGSEKRNGIVFIFDEPTTGLHFADIKKLLVALQALVDNGNTVIVIEHNTEIIKSADYVIDLGEEGGDLGGYLVFAGTPEELVQNGKGYTARFLKEKLGLD